MPDKVLHYIRERGLIRAGDRMAVAVSGGADSVALLRVLLELRSELGVVLAVAHFNHGLRGPDSDADEQFVAELAQRHDLPFFVRRGNVRGHAATNKLGIEHAARDLRYAWLTKLAQQQRFEAIATAHTFDDQAETVLMKFLRGAGTKGLSGIHPVVLRNGVRIVRPLLETPRAEVEHFLLSLNQVWREDRTNRDTRLSRNRIRHELLPLLEREYSPNIRQLLSESAEVAIAEEDYWQTEAQSFLDRWQDEPNRLRLSEFSCLPCGLLVESIAMQRRVLKRLLESYGLPFDFHHVENLRRCAVGEVPKIGLPGGWLANRDGDWLELFPPEPARESPIQGYERFLRVPGHCVVPEARLTVQATVIPAEVAANEVPGSLLRQAKLGSRLLIRNWQPGDRFRPAHSGSEEKLKRLFSEKRIPVGQRALWPVALVGSQVVWVRGFPVAYHFAWVPGSGDALRIDVLPE